MTQTGSVAGLVRAPARGPGTPKTAPKAPVPPVRPFRSGSDRPTRMPDLSDAARLFAGVTLGVLAVAGVAVRQLMSNVSVPTPSTDSEAALVVNAFALLQAPDLRIPGSVSEVVTSWQLAAYSSLTSSTDRHASVVDSAREFVLVFPVLTALLTLVICRRLKLSWPSAAFAVVLAGAPAGLAQIRITTVPAAAASGWLTLAALLAVLAVGMRRRRWPLIAATMMAAIIAVATSSVAALLILGMALGIVATQRPLGWDHRSRGLVILSLSVAVVGASWLTVWGAVVPPGGDVPNVRLVGVIVALGGLVVVVAATTIGWLRPLSVGAVPILLATAWPGPAQAPALLFGLGIVSVLSAGLLDALLRQRHHVPPGRFRAPALVTTALLLSAVTVGAFVLPPSVPAAATPIPDAAVASWIQTQLDPDAVIALAPLSRAQLVRDGISRGRLTTDGAAAADFVLAPVRVRGDLPLIARFGVGSSALGLRLVVPDPAAFVQAQLADEAARGRFGSSLASNPNLIVDAGPAAALQAGEVDARLMIALAVASASARLRIAEFVGTPADVEEAPTLREVILTDISDLDPAVGTDGAAVSRLAQFFQMQQPPYQPLAVLEEANILTVRYSAPSPPGLLP